jgi:hypothetical protein
MTVPHAAKRASGGCTCRMADRGGLSRTAVAFETVVWLLFAALLIPPAPAGATVKVGSDLHGFYDGCIAKFTAAGLRDKVDQLDRSKNVFEFEKSSGTISNPDDRTDAQNGHGTGGTTKINPTDTSPIAGESPPINHDPCATLYHEMAHLVDYDNGHNDRRECANTGGITIAEVEATRAENRYRKTQPELKNALRTNYGRGTSLPPDGVSCTPVQAKPPRQSGGCNVSAVGAPTCGVSNGDPHLTTFDQLSYDFQAVGEFVAVRSTVRDDLEIQVRQSAMPASPDASVNSAVAMNVDGDIVALYMTDDGPKLTVNGHGLEVAPQPVPLGGSGVVRRLDTDELSIVWPDGSEALLYQIGRYGFRLGLNLANGRRGSVEGLLGNFDSNPANDLHPRGGSTFIRDPTFAKLYPGFADSWRISQQESLFQYDPGQSTQSFTNRRLPTRPLEATAVQNRESAMDACRRAGVAETRLLRECIVDVSVSGSDDFAKSAADTQTVFLRRARLTTGNALAGGLRFSGRVSGQIAPAAADCTILADANQFRIALVGLLGAAKMELFVDVISGFHGTGSYAIGSIGTNGGQASLSVGQEAFASDSGRAGSLRVNPDGRSGELRASLDGVEVEGQWTCGKLTRL